MPVISCPDCNRDVSTLATACPHCGRPMGAASPLQPPPPLPGEEETLWRGTPSPKVLIGRVAGLVVILVAIPLLAHFAASMANDLDQSAKIAKLGWWITAAVFILQLVRLGIALLRIRSTLYTITTQRIIVEQGILSKSLSEIDLRTIDDTQFFQSITHRLLGIGNVTLISADKTMPTFVLHNVPNPRAMREQIRSHAYRMSQRQLYTRQA